MSQTIVGLRSIILTLGGGLSGCAAVGHLSQGQVASVRPQPSERSDPGGVAVLAALNALALGSTAFSEQDHHTQQPTDDRLRQAAEGSVP